MDLNIWALTKFGVWWLVEFRDGSKILKLEGGAVVRPSEEITALELKLKEQQ